MDNLQTLSHYSTYVLLRIRSTFPFDLFPDELTITPEEVIVKTRPFFFTEEVYPVLVRDVRAVSLTKNILFAELMLDIQGIQILQRSIRFLHIDEAETARKMITGCMIVQKEKVDISKYSGEDLKKYILSVGSR